MKWAWYEYDMSMIWVWNIKCCNLQQNVVNCMNEERLCKKRKYVVIYNKMLKFNAFISFYLSLHVAILNSQLSVHTQKN